MEIAITISAISFLYCIAKELSFNKKEKFYLEKIDALTNKLMSRDYESYMYATKREWTPKREVKQETPMMEDLGTIQSFIG